MTTGWQKYAPQGRQRTIGGVLVVAVVAAFLLGGSGRLFGSAGGPAAQLQPAQSYLTQLHVAVDWQDLVQGDEGDSSGTVPADQIKQYVAVYRDMQHDRSLSVEQAASRHGLSLAQFRDLEGKIERDDAARDQAREELQAAAPHPAPSAGSSHATPTE